MFWNGQFICSKTVLHSNLLQIKVQSCSAVVYLYIVYFFKLFFEEPPWYFLIGKMGKYKYLIFGIFIDIPMAQPRVLSHFRMNCFKFDC